ncbi:MAG: aminofutalosine synthase MqnE [Helicobacter sp.]|uniref:aminofutalosine synthase MqnE n=1 Tax=unclassified Helicobacter TaxID=2593540 RepID=UPI001F566045|nr:MULTISPECIES: aminofutalosine synthase MqnE [unclassified Helicobacter]MCI2236313.1 aminofutalosine synthase MqnE [Helicobacter sp. CaF467b]MCI7765912.1 aminofutalosine synthase MqnE [Helicobacter sp.]MDY4426884.1 aminofutalosine synthase MqnE [Helicobacter sp.]
MSKNEILKSFLVPKEALKLYDLDIFTLGKMAGAIREEYFGKKTFFNSNRHLNPTNECSDICKFCAFSAHRKNPNSYTLSKKEALEQVQKAVNNGALEIHIVGAHNPKLDLEWYLELFRTIKEKYPQIHIKALTGAEVNFLSKISNKSYQEVLELMVENGVDSMPGGGAEIFDEGIREKICKGKVDSIRWLEIHGYWHSLGKKSNATMLFGHIESREHRIDHLLRLYHQQEKSQGFNAFIPLVYQKENNFLKVKNFPSGQEILKTIAISRILLPNIPHIKAYWATLGLNLALVAQEFGADDIDGTIQKEAIQSAAGSKSANGILRDELISQIKDSGFIPVERDSLYNEIKIY